MLAAPRASDPRAPACLRTCLPAHPRARLSACLCIRALASSRIRTPAHPAGNAGSFGNEPAFAVRMRVVASADAGQARGRQRTPATSDSSRCTSRSAAFARIAFSSSSQLTPLLLRKKT
ncbi:hypothetical protein ACFPRL_09155 [Pseudoclavibacter helvolus]